MRIYLAITDKAWYETLAAHPGLDEINFWQPGGQRRFAALQPGDLFLFKLHYPEHAIAGGGVFRHATILPSSLAWDAFGEGNGAISLDEMRQRIEKYRRRTPDPHEDYPIGCVLLQQPFFFPEQDWVPPPLGFHRTIVQGKTYTTDSVQGRQLLEETQARLRLGAILASGAGQISGPVFGDLATIRPRLGQGAFRVLVTDIYERRCAVTREKALPVLEAAHIRPLSAGGLHRVENGLLLRSDVHTLYDRGYITVTPDYRVLVSQRLKKDFDNGEHYYRHAGRELWVPRRTEDKPSREHLEWHADTVYRG